MSIAPSLSMKPLVRGLSTHHWIVADITMMQSGQNKMYAGSAGRWTYYSCRDSPREMLNGTHCTYLDGRLLESVQVNLPRTKRCSHLLPSGRVCKNRSYWHYCTVHTPTPPTCNMINRAHQNEDENENELNSDQKPTNPKRNRTPGCFLELLVLGSFIAAGACIATLFSISPPFPV